ncbi:uncharacterized protein KGF55_004886 [Candida pseudojiufengensis]|uniref:uncharacterized protein n=1 Tax=Candida pseudojiufengensis TaxID=497109 RepID=UPI0022255FEB|nr:uncharacterized protein KGF55_004886 [Candida pseudojiufengensis]KAI5960163.1 hypothetical protein KGF55_004886 [Candida pseudojiufengensis]
MTNSTIASSNLFKPIKVGNALLKNRIAHLPTTRNRAHPGDHIPTDLQKIYYTDRAKNGSLLVTEATIATPKLGWYPNVPGIWNEEQALAWKEIVDSVHEAGGKIAVQLWGLGRVASPKLLKEKGYDFVGVSDIYEHEASEKEAKESGNLLRPLTVEEIKTLVTEDFPNATKLALDVAGFDYVALHFANGYIGSQFLNPKINTRTDQYGGKSVENRSRFIFEVFDNLFKVAPAQKIGVRFSPYNVFQEPGINPTSKEDYTYILSELQKRADEGNELAFIDLVDGRYDQDEVTEDINLDYFYKYWKGIILRGGNYTSDEKDDWKNIVKDSNANDRTLVGFGRHFIANPDLPERIKKNESLNKYDRSTFYTPYDYGYNTYPKFGEKNDADPNAKITGKPLA